MRHHKKENVAVEYTTVKRFCSYEINEKGKWNSYYVLEFNTDTFAYVQMICLNIKRNVIVKVLEGIFRTFCPNQ